MNNQPRVYPYYDRGNQVNALAHDFGPVTLYYSYKTLVAFHVQGHKQVVLKNYWSTTTGKHLNAIDDGNSKTAEGRKIIKERVSQADFDKAYKEQVEPFFNPVKPTSVPTPDEVAEQANDNIGQHQPLVKLPPLFPPGCVTPPNQDHEQLIEVLESQDLLKDAAEIVEPFWEDDYTAAVAEKGDPSYSILDFAATVLREHLDDENINQVRELLTV